MNFKILKKSKLSNARLGFIETEHGVIETPCLVPVATQAVVKTLTSEEVEQTNSQVLISNTFHLHLHDKDKVIERAGQLHTFMQWKRPLMTDSGGFQVFSLGFGRDFGTGKMIKASKNASNTSKKSPFAPKISLNNHPKNLKITYDGVYFNSPIDGAKLFMGPKESIKIQERLGADIIFAFDECTSPVADYAYTKKSLEKTHQWAEICLHTKKTKQALFGIVQGGKYQELRQESARFIGNLEFDGFGIGGEFGDDKSIMPQMLDWVMKELPERKPRHLLGIGYLEDMETIIKCGVDTFDCTVPTHYARRGFAFTSQGKLNMHQVKYLKSNEPLDKGCTCLVCLKYKKNYICHLLRVGEITALKLLTFHNLCYFNNAVEELRKKIKQGEL